MSSANHTIKALGEGALDLQRRLDAAEGKVAELQRQLNLSHEALRGAQDALRDGIKQLEEGTWEPVEVLDTMASSLREIAEVLP